MLSAADRTEIHQLVARSNRAFDEGDVDEWTDCFTEEGRWEGDFGPIAGRAALRAFAREFREDPRFERFRNTHQWVSNVIVEGDGDEATLVCDHLFIQAREGGPRILVVCACDDRLCKVDGRWCFASRTLTALPAGEAPP